MTDGLSTLPSSQHDMRRALLDAALAVLQRDGAAGLTVRAITQVAGCSTTGIYTYFGGKHGLVEALFLEGFESFDAAVSLGYDGALDAAGRAYRRWALANPMHYLVMFGRAVPEYVPSDQALVRAAASFAKLVEGVRRAGAGDAAESVAYHIYATVHGYVMLELVGMAPPDQAERDAAYEAGLRHLERITHGTERAVGRRAPAG